MPAGKQHGNADLDPRTGGHADRQSFPDRVSDCNADGLSDRLPNSGRVAGRVPDGGTDCHPHADRQPDADAARWRPHRGRDAIYVESVFDGEVYSMSWK
jgi:hypothetical protein